MDLTTRYLGMTLKNPLVVSASPISREVGSIRALEDAGVSMVVLFSLFQEQIDHEISEYHHYRDYGAEAYPEATSYLPGLDYSPTTSQSYLDHLAKVKEAVGVPVVASLNGSSLGGWTRHAALLEQAGADALELNIYHVPSDPKESAQDVENRYLEIARSVKQEVKIPVALKIGPYFSSLPHFAKRLETEGIDALVLFNRFYQPDIDLERLDVRPDVVFSSPHEMRLPLRWIAILDPIVNYDLAATTGVYTSQDVLKLVMAGADAVMLCAVLLRHGPPAANQILHGIRRWMDENEYESIEQMKGSMNHHAGGDPSRLERANYMRGLRSYI